MSLMQNDRSPAPRRPELLAPAGDADCARAAVENGADAVYFGLRTGLSARARAVNFAPEDLPELMTNLHRRGVRGYVTLNTLVFPSELATLEQTVRRSIAAGVDAVLVQDLGAARLIRKICPDWPMHASTQMSLTSAEGIRVAESLGIQRVVLARELSLDEVRRIRSENQRRTGSVRPMALCASATRGQCMASLAMGGRSGNRGQCAQPCRLPYELLGDSVDQDRRPPVPAQPSGSGGLRSRAAVDRGRRHCDEDRGSPQIGRSTWPLWTRHYRQAIDEALAGRPLDHASEEVDALEVSFSRGFSHGWLDGHNDRLLVPGQSSTKRGVVIGQVRAIGRERVTVALTGSIKRGDGVVFETDADDTPQGGRVYEVFLGRLSVKEAISDGLADLTFAHDSIDFGRLRPGQKVWKTDDPQLTRRLRKTFAAGQTNRRVPLNLVVEAAVGRPLRISAKADSGAACRIESTEPLQEAIQHSLTAELLEKQLGRLGGSVYELRRLDARIDGRPMVPLSVLGRLRQELIQKLDATIEQRPTLAMAASSPLLDDVSPESKTEPNNGRISWHILCRNAEQLSAALARKPSSVTADFAQIDQYAAAVRSAQGQGVPIYLATPRIQKPGEAGLFRQIADARPDGILVRNLAGVAFCAARHIPFVADSSLNAANPRTAAYLRELGAARVTAAYDVDGPRLLELVAATPPRWLEVVVYQHLPLFHTEHCLFCAMGIAGANRQRCGRPCRQRDVRLRDRYGVDHRLRSDACCRNTVYHAQPRSLIDLTPELRRLGVRHFRIELLDGMPHDMLADLMRDNG